MKFDSIYIKMNMCSLGKFFRPWDICIILDFEV